MTRRLGQYELISQLGRGAMAVVWRARDLNLEREVAVKEPTLPSGVDDAMAAELGERFVREARAAGALNHPGIVTVYNADVADGRPYMAMELIEGGTLSDLIRPGGMPLGDVRAIVDQLLDALGYAHAHGIVHRDVKPDNVFVSHDGRVKLADFGIAHVGDGTVLTQAGTLMGTPGYMAPEQVVGSAVDSRADIFAVGVIAYELFTGVNPFGASEGQPATTIMYRIVHEAPAPAAASSAEAPAWFTSVLDRALAKDPACRYAAAAEMQADLRACRAPAAAPGGSAAPAPFPAGAPPQWSPVLSSPVVRTLAALGAAVAVVAFVLFAVFGSSGGSMGGGTAAPSTSTAPGNASAATPESDQQVAVTAPAAAPTDPVGDPASAVRAYYDDLNAHDMNAALQHFSSKKRRSMDTRKYAASFDNLAHADVNGCATARENGSNATVDLNVYVKSRSSSGSGTWSGTVSLVKEGGTWRITALNLQM
jgi:eukaryotic-like serine/threonine-protein kinase